MSPKVSVIVPVFNSEEYLGQCLDSILLQKMDDLEVICVNNASTDGSASILQTYSMFDSRLRVINSENLNNSAMKNIGIEQAKGEFITFLNPIDCYEETMLERAISLLDKDQSDFLVSGCFLYDDKESKIVNEIKIDKSYLDSAPITSEKLQQNFFLLKNPSCWNQVYRSSFIRNNDLKFDENVCNFGDISFLSQGLIFPAKISLSGDPLLLHRTNIDKKNENPLDDIFISTLLTMRNIYDKLGDKKNDSSILSSYISHLSSIIAQTLVLSTRDKKENILSIPKYIPHDVMEKIFFCPKPHVKVSLVIYVHGSENDLERCLESVIHQTLKEIEIICVDCSDDSDLLPILERYAKIDERIKILTKQQYKEENSPYDRGMKFITGMYAQFLDSNDCIELDTCEALFIYSQLYKLDMCLYSMDDTDLLPCASDYLDAVFNINYIQNNLFELTINSSATFYRYCFLASKKIQWKSKTVFSEFPFFVESAMKAKRLGRLSSPLYHKDNRIVVLEKNLKDYTLRQNAVLKLIKKCIPQAEILNKYMDDLSICINSISKKTNDKKIKSDIYYLYFSLLKKFHCHLRDEVFVWCKNYLKKKNIFKRLNFRYYLLINKIIRDQYSINLITFRRRPFVCFSLLGIPIFKMEISPIKSSKCFFRVKIFAIPVLCIRKKEDVHVVSR